MPLPFASPTLAAINDLIRDTRDKSFRIRTVSKPRQHAGRHSSSSLLVSDGRKRYFVKVQSAAHGPAFAAEVAGLRALRDAGIRAPAPISWGTSEGTSEGTSGEGETSASEAFIVLEYLRLRPPRDGDYVGLALMIAQLHDHSDERFGWPDTNFIGPTPQWNTRTKSWADFWHTERLAPQLALAARNGFGGMLQSLGERVLARLDRLLGDHRPIPSLLHGDLWQGNAGFLTNGEPVFFDPAVYYGDREADLAMTELFGGFPRIFYDTYFERLPMADGYPARRDLYNLYHVLNHLNLFGDQYRIKAEGLMRDLLTRIE